MELQLPEIAASGVSWPIYLASALALLGIWIGRHYRSRKSADSEGVAISTTNSTATSGLVYTNAPTVRLGDSQRIDRLRRALSLRTGEHADLLDATFDGVPRLRITLRSIEKDDRSKEHARLHLELGGAVAGCGALVKHVGTNEFLTPVATQEEQPSSILHFSGQGESMSFLRVKVTRLSAADQSADIDVLQVCGRWTS